MKLKEGTPNFASLQNAGAYQVVCPDEFEPIEDVASDVCGLMKSDSKLRKYFYYCMDGEWERDSNRSYPEANVAMLSADISYDYVVNFRVFLISGYYECANFDWEIGIGSPYGTDIDENDPESGIEEDMYDYPEDFGILGKNDEVDGRKLKKVKAKILKEIDKATATIDKALDSFFKKNYDTYTKAYQFSNGEAGYTKMKESFLEMFIDKA